MNKNLKKLYNEIDEIFSQPQTENQKAWGMIHDFYHQILTYMDENEITKADLAKRLGKSRAAISQMFNKTPNITIIKMVEIAEAVGVELNLETNYFQEKREARHKETIEYVYVMPSVNRTKNLYTPLSLNDPEESQTKNTRHRYAGFHKRNQLEFIGQMDNTER